jgi:hypothetical protein
VFRKTLTPMHGVFRSYQTLLVLYAFMKWAAKLSALRGGRSVAAATEVRDAARVVEQRFRPSRALRRHLLSQPGAHRHGGSALPTTVLCSHRRPRASRRRLSAPTCRSGRFGVARALVAGSRDQKNRFARAIR